MGSKARLSGPTVRLGADSPEVTCASSRLPSGTRTAGAGAPSAVGSTGSRKSGGKPVYSGGLIQTSRLAGRRAPRAEICGATEAPSRSRQSPCPAASPTTTTRNTTARSASGSAAASPGRGRPTLRRAICCNSRWRCACQRSRDSGSLAGVTSSSCNDDRGRWSRPLSRSSLCWASSGRGSARRRAPRARPATRASRKAASTTRCSQPGRSGRTSSNARPRKSPNTPSGGHRSSHSRSQSSARRAARRRARRPRVCAGCEAVLPKERLVAVESLLMRSRDAA
jgi:hypothetical protein